MDLSSLTVRQLRYLDAVADGRTFSEAADDLFVSQSALSQGLARLESLVGVAVFESDGRRRRLTDAGEALAAAARRALGEIDIMATDLEARSVGRTGMLRLGMIDAAALYLFSQAIGEFRRMHREVQIRITVKVSDDCLTRLAAFEDDMSIVVGPANGFDCVDVAEEDFFLFGPSSTVPADAPWALYPTASQTRALIDQGLRRAGHTPIVVDESGNPDVLRQLTILNGGWTVLPANVAEASGLRRGRRIATRQIVVARRRGSPDNPLANAFVQQLIGR